MKSLTLTGAITALANAVAGILTAEKTALLSSVFVQLGDTLATIVAEKSLLLTDNSDPCAPCEND
jgi:hypothetical protein